jgi:thiol-disulfide isomerase/thioredoxin
MKFNLTLLAAAVLLAAACAPKAGKTTRVVGQFGEDAPAVVDISIDGVLDTTVVVTDGRFEVELPKDLTTMAVFQPGYGQVTFFSDGSTITIDPDAGTAVSSNKKGPHARYVAYNDWMEAFMADYREKMSEFSEDDEAAEEYFDGVLEQFNDYQKETVRANPDNILGLFALSQVKDDDTDELLALLDGLSDEIKALPEAAQMRTALESQGKAAEAVSKTAEGSPFVDFTVVQEPGVPEASTVKFSDYVGNGKFVLVDFWASWCVPCREEMPNLKKIYETYAGPNFDMLSVAVADELSETRKAAEELGITWNQIVNAQQIPLEIYGIEAIPHIILFGPDGTILKRNLRGEAIGEAVKEALGY